jgi:hypothetical protein
MSLLPLTGQPVSLTLILVELAQPERKRYTKAHSCRCEGVAYADHSSVAGAITDVGRRVLSGWLSRIKYSSLHVEHSFPAYTQCCFVAALLMADADGGRVAESRNSDTSPGDRSL